MDGYIEKTSFGDHPGSVGQPECRVEGARL